VGVEARAFSDHAALQQSAMLTAPSDSGISGFVQILTGFDWKGSTLLRTVPKPANSVHFRIKPAHIPAFQ
jgi:hypothetical protein